MSRILASLAFLIGAVATAQPPKEPQHEGKALPEWVKLLGSDDPAARAKAEEAVRALAANSDAAPEALLAAAAHPDSRSVSAARMIAEFGARSVPTLNAGLWSTDERTRKLSLLLIGRIGPDARSVAPSLERLLADPNEETRRTAVGCLWEVGAHRSIPALTKVLDDRSAAVRLIAADSLVRLGADAKPVLDPLIELTRSEKPEEVNASVAILGMLGPEGAAAVPALVALIPRDDAELTVRLAQALGAIGPAAKEAIPAFKKRLATDKHKGTEIAAEIALALWRIGRDPDAEKLLREHLGTSLRPHLVAEALRRIDAGKAPAAPLEELLKSERPDLAIAAASALGTSSKEAIPLLGRMLANKDSKVRASALIAIVRLGPRAKPLLEQLRGVAKDDNPTIAFGASVLVCRLATSPESLAAVAGFLSDRDAYFRSSAAEMLGLLGANAKPATSKLLLALDDGEPTVRLAAAGALWRIEKHPLALPALTAMLRSADPRTREMAAVEIGGTFGADAASGVPELVKRLFDSHAAVRSAAAEAIGRIGPAAKEAAPVLVAILDSDQPSFVLSAACEALGLIQPADKDAASAVVRRMLEHPDPGVRVHAALALWHLAADAAGAKVAEGALEFRSYQARVTAAEALWRMKQDPRAVPLLVKTLEESNLDGSLTENERYMAARALGRLGPAAKAAVPELVKLVHHHESALAATALEALKSIDPDAAKAAGVK